MAAALWDDFFRSFSLPDPETGEAARDDEGGKRESKSYKNVQQYPEPNATNSGEKRDHHAPAAHDGDGGGEIAGDA